MSDHVRKQIRDAVKTTLAGLTTTGARAFTSRVYPLAMNEYPCILIYTKEEAARIATLDAPRRSERTLTLTVEAVTQLSAVLDDTLDQICKEVEVALTAAPTLGGLSQDLWLARTEVQLNDEGAIPFGKALMEWSIEYDVHEFTPDVPV